MSQSYYSFPVCLLFFPIPLLLLVAIISILLLVSWPPCNIPLLVSYPRKYHFTYPCCNRLLLILILLSLLELYYLCTDSFASPCHNHRSASPCLFTLSWSSSTHIFASLISLHLSFLKQSFPCGDFFSSPCCDFQRSSLCHDCLDFPQFWCFCSTINNTKTMTRGQPQNS